MGFSGDIYEYYSNMERDRILLSYKGEITSKVLSYLLEIVEDKLESLSERSKTKKRMFNVLVECLQNLYHHVDITYGNLPISSSEKPRHVIIMIRQEDDAYIIMTGNYIESQNVEILKGKIDNVNNLSKEELRTYSTHVLRHDEFSDKGGAGLGLIDMARKTGNKLDYNFQQINDSLSFFNLNLKVSK